MFSNFFSENRAVYEKTWKNSGKPNRPQTKKWRRRIACWLPKATNTFRICNTYCSALQQWLHEHPSLLRYTYIACLLKTDLFRLSWVPISARRPNTHTSVCLSFPQSLQLHLGRVTDAIKNYLNYIYIHSYIYGRRYNAVGTETGYRLDYQTTVFNSRQR